MIVKGERGEAADRHHSKTCTYKNIQTGGQETENYRQTAGERQPQITSNNYKNK